MKMSPLMSGGETCPSLSVTHCAPTAAPERRAHRTDHTSCWALAPSHASTVDRCLTVLQSFTAQSDLNSRIFPRSRRYQQNGSQEQVHVAVDVSSSPLKLNECFTLNSTVYLKREAVWNHLHQLVLTALVQPLSPGKWKWRPDDKPAAVFCEEQETEADSDPGQFLSFTLFLRLWEMLGWMFRWVYLWTASSSGSPKITFKKSLLENKGSETFWFMFLLSVHALHRYLSVSAWHLGSLLRWKRPFWLWLQRFGTSYHLLFYQRRWFIWFCLFSWERSSWNQSWLPIATTVFFRKEKFARRWGSLQEQHIKGTLESPAIKYLIYLSLISTDTLCLTHHD